MFIMLPPVVLQECGTQGFSSPQLWPPFTHHRKPFSHPNDLLGLIRSGHATLRKKVHLLRRCCCFLVCHLGAVTNATQSYARAQPQTAFVVTGGGKKIATRVPWQCHKLPLACKARLLQVFFQLHFQASVARMILNCLIS